MGSEVHPDVLKATQQSLGKYVKRPALTAKLLAKPPFRFLQDVVAQLVRDTGFMKGLFTEAELNHEHVKDREAKAVFLQKLIDATKLATGKKLAVKPNKIIAGLEADRTNELLQAIGYAIEKKLDTSEAVRATRGTKSMKGKPIAKENTRELRAKKDVEKKPSPRQKKPEETPQSTPRAKAEPERKSSRERSPMKEAEKDAEKEAEKGAENEAEKGTEKEAEKEAEKEPEKVNDQSKPEAGPAATEPPEEQAVEIKASPSAASIIEETTERPAEPAVEERTPPRPRTALRPSTARLPSARPGAPRLHRPDPVLPPEEFVPMGRINVIVDNFDQPLDEEETVTVEAAPMPELPELLMEPDISEKGHLVSQILEQIGDEASGAKANVSIEWEKGGPKGREALRREVELLRTFIQRLTKAANPLGKLTSYLQEDVDAMFNELEAWKEANRRITREIEDQKRLTEESVRPLKEQLKRTEESILKQQEQISNSKAQILKNEKLILELLAR